MTLSSETTVDRYAAAEDQTVFAYTFRIDDADHLDVYAGDALQASGYTVSNVGDDNGGNVTFATAPRASGGAAVTVTLIRNVPPTQLTDLPTQGSVDTAAIEAELDRFAMRLQQVEEKLGRALLLAESSTTSGLVLPELEASKTLGTNASGDAYVLATLSDPDTLTVTSFAETLLDDTTAAAALTTLGVSSFVQTLLDDADVATFRQTLGVIGKTPAIFGLGTSNNGTDGDHDIDVATGVCFDATGAEIMELSSVLTKQIDAVWAVGDDAGGLDTGAVAADTLYAVWLIKRSDTSVVDAMFSTNFTAPTMPMNYDFKRLIGAVVTDGSSNIIAYTQVGDYFRYTGDILFDISDGTITNGAWETGTLSAPPNSRAYFYAIKDGDGSAVLIWTRPVGGAEDTSHHREVTVGNNHASDNIDPRGWGQVLLDGSSQFQYAASHNTSSAVYISTFGFDLLTRSNP